MRKNNGQWILKSRPEGLVERVNFEWREEPIPTIRDGQFLVRNLWLSCDPTQRPWMQFDTYIPAVPLGDVMYSVSAGQVVESRHVDFKPGDKVTGAWGWQDYAVTDGSGLVPATKIPAGVDFPTALSLFGITGLRVIWDDTHGLNEHERYALELAEERNHLHRSSSVVFAAAA